MKNEEFEPEKATGWLVATYIFAALGGFLGVVLGFFVYFVKVHVYDEDLDDYVKEYRFVDTHRMWGLIGGILAIISVVYWKYLYSQ
jgi:hypothetical protein